MKKVFILFIVWLFQLGFLNLLQGEILFKISGQVLFNGNGVKGIILNVRNSFVDKEVEVETDSNGYYSAYIPNGRYIIKIIKSDGFVCKTRKEIQVDNRNVVNILFYLEKECRISGYVKFQDGNPISGSVLVKNDKSSGISEIDKTGKYLVKKLLPSKSTEITFLLDGIANKKIENIELNEGIYLENISLILQRINSVCGKACEKATLTPLEEVEIAMIVNHDLTNTEDEYIMNHILTRTNEKGEYCFYNIPPGNHFIYWDIENGYKPDRIFFTILNNESKNVNVLIEK